MGDGRARGFARRFTLWTLTPILRRRCFGPKHRAARNLRQPGLFLNLHPAAGTHTIAYLSRDNAGNEEAPRQANFTVNLTFSAPADNKPPRTTLTIGARNSGPRRYLSPPIHP